MAERPLSIIVKATGATAAAQQIGQVDKKVSALGSHSGQFAATIKRNVSGALGTFSGRLKGLATASAGLLGVTGLLGVAGALHEGLDEARTFGDEVIRLAKVTGLTTEQTSALAAAMHHYGIDADTALRISGMAEKNLGVLTKTTASAKKFQKDYGLSVIDSAGHVKSFNDLLLDSADFFNDKSVPAQKKAAALAKIYGRNWQELVPILGAGRKGIADAEEEAKRLGLTLTTDNVDALKKSKDATRDWNTALGGLKLQIGLALLPAITDLAKAATAFVSTHRGDIVQFFKDAISFGRTAAGAIGSFAGQVAGAWNSIPGPMRDFLVKGIVADRTVKFLFGFSITDVAKNLVGGVASGLGNSLVKAGIGKAFVQPVFVTNMGAGGLGGLPGVTGGGGSPSVLGTGLKLIPVVAAGVMVGEAVAEFDRQNGITPRNVREEEFFRQLLKTLQAPHKGQDDAENAAHARNTAQAPSTGTAHLQKIETSLEDQRHQMLAKFQSGINTRDTAVVSAIRTSRPIVNVAVRVSGQRVTIVKNYQSGSTVGSGIGGGRDLNT